jgi:hypothetical protein
MIANRGQHPARDGFAQTAVIARSEERLKSTLGERLYSNAQQSFQ